MAWTAQKDAPLLVRGQACQRVFYTDGVETFDVTYFTDVVDADWPDREIRARRAKLNAIDFTLLTAGATRPEPTPKPPPPPTQDAINLAAFVALCTVARTQQAELKAGVGKTQPADLDATLGQIKTTYQEQYAPLIVGLF